LAAAWDPGCLPPPKSIPWQAVLPVLDASGLGAIVYALTRPVQQAMPPDAVETLKRSYYRSIALNTRLVHQLAHVGKELSRSGATILLLKGAALAQQLYGHAGLRPIGDIDLTVAPEHVAACRQILIELGYVPRHHGVRVAELRSQNNQEMFDPQNSHQAPVELHWHLFDTPYYHHHVPMDWFWANSETYSIVGQSFQVLSPVANLVYLPAHLALHHKYDSLHSHLDLALLIAKEQNRLDWGMVFSTAQSFELLTVLRETLDRLATCWPSLPIRGPHGRYQSLAPTQTDTRLFRLLTAESSDTSLNIYTTLASLPGFSARAQYLWTNLFPRPAYMQRKYRFEKPWQLPYWYAYRLVMGITRLARALPAARRLDRGRG
jgi:hypothetical protein